MTEEFLHYLWKFRLVNKELQTRSGEPVTIIHPGEHNRDSGPDFLNARIRLGETVWAGNIEIHLNEYDWYRHNHHLDNAYSNVILHVVFEGNTLETTRFEERFPTVILQGQFPESIYHRYQDVLRNISRIPCEKLIQDHDLFYFGHWSSSLLVERLADKSTFWEKLLEINKFDWAETLHQGIARSFGLKINTLPFELLAKSLPLKIILKYKESPLFLESLAFGQAGMLNRDFPEEYPKSLRKEYDFLSQKHNLKPIDPSLWKFLRLRPSAFPTIRIAQWANLLQHAGQFFPTVIDCDGIESMERFFSPGTSKYWDDHFTFDKLSSFQPKRFGESSVQMLIINTVAPFIYFYGDQKGLNNYKEKALALIEEIPGENNAVINYWKTLGLPVDNALKTQALMQLRSNYCDRKRCLECRIGVRILAKSQ